VKRIEPRPDDRNVRDRRRRRRSVVVGIPGEFDPGLRGGEELRGVGDGGLDRVAGDDPVVGHRLQRVPHGPAVGVVDRFDDVVDGDAVGLLGVHTPALARLARRS
jgi:hypothetical protein